jgi:hypothetical protein
MVLYSPMYADQSPLISLSVVRRSLEAGLAEMGLSVEVARSDDEFQQKGTQDGGMAKYDVILLDAWTWVRRTPPKPCGIVFN